MGFNRLKKALNSVKPPSKATQCALYTLDSPKNNQRTNKETLHGWE